MKLTRDDIDILREHVFPKGLASSDDAATLLALNTACPEKCAQWADYFIGEMTAFIVHHCFPQGSMDDINTRWLIAMISRDGVVSTQVEIELLRRIIDASRFVPVALSVFALKQLDVPRSAAAGTARRRLATSVMRARGSALTDLERHLLGPVPRPRAGVDAQGVAA
ncbi:hypothetical protein [Ensifer soli]|uniref:hypothetical protein n=1 Tax=Ciceribacter sp. sgz301302 TaxID=3342379 RepID=UPI0035B865A2